MNIFEILPNEIISSVVSYVGDDSIMNLKLVNHRMNDIIDIKYEEKKKDLFRYNKIIDTITFFQLKKIEDCLMKKHYDVSLLLENGDYPMRLVSMIHRTDKPIEFHQYCFTQTKSLTQFGEASDGDYIWGEYQYGSDNIHHFTFSIDMYGYGSSKFIFVSLIFDPNGNVSVHIHDTCRYYKYKDSVFADLIEIMKNIDPETFIEIIGGKTFDFDKYMIRKSIVNKYFYPYDIMNMYY
jgi:hypothetical protein